MFSYVSVLLACLAGLSLSVALAFPVLLVLAAERAADRGDPGRAKRLLSLVAWVPGRANRVERFLVLESIRHAAGEPLDAAVLARVLSETRPAMLRLSIVNTGVNGFTTDGRYLEAVRLADGAGDAPPFGTGGLWELIQINAADALWNLGDLAGAKARCDRIVLEAVPPIVIGGIWVQRAWMVAHEGLGDLALAMLEPITPEMFPRLYRSELYFARAAACLAAGAPAQAAADLEVAERLAMRASTKRNLLFLRGRVAAARGELARAVELCRAAAEHPFRRQGGDGLLFWGTCLAQLGREGEAREAWSLAMKRDPESLSARLAADRLGVAAALAG